MNKMAIIQSLNRAWILAGLLTAWVADAQNPPPLAVTNQSLLPDGRGQVKVLTPSNTTYSLEWSSDLKTWKHAFTWDATNNSMIIQSQDSFVSMDRIFLRARVGRGLYGTMSLLLFANGGSFGAGNCTPTVSFPIAVSAYSAAYEIEDDTAYPAGSAVLFSSPPGFGLTNTPAQFYNIDSAASYAWYQSPQITSALIPTGGVWQVTYKATNLSCTLSPPQANTRLVIPVPTVTVANDLVQSVTWVYKNAATGANFTSAPACITKIQVQADSSSGGRVYNSDWLMPASPQHTLPTPVYWSSLSALTLAYVDTLGNQYVVFFRK